MAPDDRDAAHLWDMLRHARLAVELTQKIAQSVLLAVTLVTAAFAQEAHRGDSEPAGSDSIQSEPLLPAPSSSDPVDPATPLQPESVGVNFEVGSELVVVATSLAFRSAPGTDAPLIDYIPQGDLVTVLSNSKLPVEEIIAGRAGWWLYVVHGARRGYVFDAYVKASPESAEDAIKFRCVPGVGVGPITRSTTYTDLVAAFGAENLERTEMGFGDSDPEPVTVIFSGTARELIVKWEIPDQVPASVEVVGAKWRTPAGIGVGTPLSELVRLNNREFYFWGFGWDYGGTIRSWDGGALEADHKLNEQIRMGLDYLGFMSSEARTLSGDTGFSSENPAAARSKLFVSWMEIRFSR